MLKLSENVRSIDARAASNAATSTRTCLPSWATRAEFLRSDFVAKVFETYATQLIKIVIGIATSVLMARILHPQGRGLFAIAGALAATAIQFGNFGLHASNTYYVARDPELLPALTGNALVTAFGVGTILAVLLRILATLAPGLVLQPGATLDLALFLVPFGLSYLLLQNLLLGLHQVRAFNIVELANRALPLLLILLLIAFHRVSVSWVFSTTLAATVITTLWCFLELKKHLQQPPTVSFRVFKDSFRYASKAYVLALLSFLVLRSDLFLVKHMLGSEQAGYYSISATMADLVSLLAVTIGTILFPKLTAVHDPHKKLRLVWKATIGTAIAMAPLSLGAAILARPLVLILYGPAFAPSAVAFRLLMPGIFFLCIHCVSVQFLNSIGFPKSVICIWACCLVLNVSANAIYIPRFGIAGAAIVSTVSYCLATALVLAEVWRRGRALAVKVVGSAPPLSWNPATETCLGE